MSDELGYRGEHLFRSIITRYVGGAEPLFRVKFLGDKWPLVDFLVELRNVMPATPYFFVQVRATRRSVTREGRLRARASDSDMRRLAAHFAPTYLVGIDEANEKGYIISANGETSGGLSSFPTDLPLNDANQPCLSEKRL